MASAGLPMAPTSSLARCTSSSVGLKYRLTSDQTGRVSIGCFRVGFGAHRPLAVFTAALASIGQVVSSLERNHGRSATLSESDMARDRPVMRQGLRDPGSRQGSGQTLESSDSGPGFRESGLPAVVPLRGYSRGSRYSENKTRGTGNGPGFRSLGVVRGCRAGCSNSKYFKSF